MKHFFPSRPKGTRSRMVTRCEDIQPRLAAFLLGELSQREADRVASHVPECENCYRELESLRATVGLLMEFGEADSALLPRDAVVAELAERAYRKRRARTLALSLPFRRWGSAVAALAVVAMLLAVLLRPASSPVRSHGAARSSSGDAARTQTAPVAESEQRPAVAESPQPRTAAPLSAVAVGRIVTVKGTPQIRTADSAWGPCRAAQAVAAGAEVKTGDTDRLEVELADGSRVNFDFGTSARFETTSSSGRPSRPTAVRLSQGKLWLLVTPAEKSLVVKTPAGTAEALGTLFSVAVATEPHLPSEVRPGGTDQLRVSGKGPHPEPGSRTSVTVIEGKVQLSNPWGAVAAGRDTYTEATAGQAPRPPRGLKYLRTVRLQTPWGQTSFEVWITERLKQDGALDSIAGRRSWIGLTLAPDVSSGARASPALLSGEDRGVRAPVVIGVAPGSPAARGGVQPEDRLTQIGAISVESPADMVKSEQLLPAGQPVDVVVRRGDRLIRLTLTPVDRWRVGDKKEDPGLAEANRAFAMGKLTDAEQGYRAILGRDRNNAGAAVAWNNLGVINHLQDRLEAATWAYREAIRLAPKVALYHLNLGTCFSRIGNLQRAREELAAALGLDPECQGARFLLGRAEALMGDFDSAIQQARLLEAGPDAGAGARAAGAGGQGAPVDAELRRRRSQGYFLEGEILRIQGNLDASESWYLKAAAEDPYYVDPPTALGAIHYDRGESDEAERWLGKALALDPSSLRALNRMGLLLTKTGDLERAEQMLRKAARLYPDSSIVQSNLGRVYLKKGALGLARAAFRRGVDLAPETTLSHELLAIGLEASGQFAEAKREYELALRFDPAYQEGYRRLASLHRRLGEVTLAESVLGRARHYTQ